MVRYVDDTLNVSYTLCPACVEALQITQYSPHITFDPDATAIAVEGVTVKVKYLDFELKISLDSLSYFHHSRNTEAIYGVDHCLLQKHRMAPYVGDGQLSTFIFEIS